LPPKDRRGVGERKRQSAAGGHRSHKMGIKANGQTGVMKSRRRQGAGLVGDAEPRMPAMFVDDERGPAWAAHGKAWASPRPPNRGELGPMRATAAGRSTHRSKERGGPGDSHHRASRRAAHDDDPEVVPPRRPRADVALGLAWLIDEAHSHPDADKAGPPPPAGRSRPDADADHQGVFTRHGQDECANLAGQGTYGRVTATSAERRYEQLVARRPPSRSSFFLRGHQWHPGALDLWGRKLPMKGGQAGAQTAFWAR